MTVKQNPGSIYAPDGSLYVTLTDGDGSLINFDNSITMAVVGDSIMAATIASNSGNNVYNTARGPSFWMAHRSGRRIDIPQSLNFAVAGHTSTNTVALLDTIKASNAGIYYVATGTNDTVYATLIANLETIWSTLLGTGAHVFAQTILPRTLATQATRDMFMRVNQYIRAQAQRHTKFHVVDPSVNFGDPLATDWTPKTSPSVHTYDGLHPKTQGAFLVAEPAVQAINQLFPAIGPAMTSVADVYSANNPGGNLLTNGILDGTGGTTTGGGGTGGTITATGVATGWIAQHAINGGDFTNLTSTWTKSTMTDGRPAQRIVLSGTYTGVGSAVDVGSQVALRHDKTSAFTDYVVGDVFSLAGDIEVAASSAGVAGIECQLTFTIGGTNYIIGDGSGFPGDLIGPSAYTGSFRTPPFTLPSGTITLVRSCIRIWMLTGSGVTATLDVKIGGMKLFKVQ